jgi:hypothetical protein
LRSPDARVAARVAAQASEIRATGRVTVTAPDGSLSLVLVVGAHRGLWALTKLVGETSRRWTLTHLPTGRKLPGVRIPKAQAGRVFAMLDEADWNQSSDFDPKGPQFQTFKKVHAWAQEHGYYRP